MKLIFHWAKYVENKIFKIGGIEFYWQAAIKDAIKSDLVIVEQANKLLINYILIVLRRFTKIKFAFWGHGINLRTNPNSSWQ